MDISSPAVFVNGELLKMHTGRRVRSVVQVVRVDTGGFIAQTSDGLQLSVKATTVDPLSKFVEVIGVAEGNQTIRAEMCTNFGDAFGTNVNYPYFGFGHIIPSVSASLSILD